MIMRVHFSSGDLGPTGSVYLRDTREKSFIIRYVFNIFDEIFVHSVYKY